MGSSECIDTTELGDSESMATNYVSLSSLRQFDYSPRQFDYSLRQFDYSLRQFD